MSLLVDPSEPATPPGPEQGVIDDARRRQRRRRRRTAALIVIVGVGALAAIVLGGGGSVTAPRSKVEHTFTAATHARRAPAPRGASLTPNLTGGAYGWCLTVDGGGSCPIVPTDGSELDGALVGSEPRKDTEVLTLLLGPQAVAVLVDGKRVPAVTIAALPYHLRVATITISRPSAPAGHTGNGAPPSPGPLTPQSLLAVDAQGHILRSTHPYAGEPSARSIWWKRPTALPKGPCQIHAHGVPGLQPEWGHVAASIAPYPERIVGRAFFSCIDTEYYLHNWPLDAAILLDAQHPGATPAAIPGLRRLSGAPAIYNGPGDGFHGPETAVRKGDAWLIVAGGSGLAQRIDVLEHLSASVEL
jgi:hypothetical protein